MKSNLCRLLVIVMIAFAACLPTNSSYAYSSISEEQVIEIIKELQTAGDNQKELWNKLSKDEQAAVMEFITPVKYTVTDKMDVVDQPKALTGCWGATREIAAYNGAGSYRTWTFYNYLAWCHNGTNVTSVTPSVWGTVGSLSLGWTYKGKLSDSLTPLPNSFAQYFSQGHFALCLWEVCAPNDYPWLRTTMRPDGTFTPEQGF